MYFGVVLSLNDCALCAHAQWVKHNQIEFEMKFNAQLYCAKKFNGVSESDI